MLVLNKLEQEEKEHYDNYKNDVYSIPSQVANSDALVYTIKKLDVIKAMWRRENSTLPWLRVSEAEIKLINATNENKKKAKILKLLEIEPEDLLSLPKEKLAELQGVLDELKKKEVDK